VVQVPSEQALRVYEHAARIERQQQQQRNQAGRPSAPAPSPPPQSSSGLTKALVAAVAGDNHGSGMVSVSA
jgi:hypothetical protein